MKDVRVAYHPDDDVEAEALRQLLAEEGIHCSLRRDGDTAYPGVADAKAGSGAILVDASELEDAQNLIAEWLEADAEMPGLGPYRGGDDAPDDYGDRTTGLQRGVKVAFRRLAFGSLAAASLAGNAYFLLRNEPRDQSIALETDPIALGESGEVRSEDDEGRLLSTAVFREGLTFAAVSEHYDVSGTLTDRFYDDDGDGRVERSEAFLPSGVKISFFDTDEDGWWDRSEATRGERVLYTESDLDGDGELEHTRFGDVELSDRNADGFPDRIECGGRVFDVHRCDWAPPR